MNIRVLFLQNRTIIAGYYQQPLNCFSGRKASCNWVRLPIDFSLYRSWIRLRAQPAFCRQTQQFERFAQLLHGLANHQENRHITSQLSSLRAHQIYALNRSQECRHITLLCHDSEGMTAMAKWTGNRYSRCAVSVYFYTESTTGLWITRRIILDCSHSFCRLALSAPSRLQGAVKYYLNLSAK